MPPHANPRHQPLLVLPLLLLLLIHAAADNSLSTFFYSHHCPSLLSAPSPPSAHFLCSVGSTPEPPSLRSPVDTSMAGTASSALSPHPSHAPSCCSPPPSPAPPTPRSSTSPPLLLSSIHTTCLVTATLFDYDTTFVLVGYT